MKKENLVNSIICLLKIRIHNNNIVNFNKIKGLKDIKKKE